MARVQVSAPWSWLPSELLGLVFLHLRTRADRAVFPAVCRAWCSAARQCHLPQPSPVPWIMLPGGSATSFPRGETFHLPDGASYHNSCGEWLLLSRSGYGYFLMNPFTKATVPLPSLYSYSYYREPVDFAEDYMVQENNRPGTWGYKCRHDISVVSLVVCSTRLIAAIVAVGDLGTIALCRPGAVAWSVSAREQCRWLSHMVFFQGKLYALDRNNGSEDLISIDIVDEHDNSVPRVSRIERLIEGISLPPQQDIMRRCYLVESHDTLLMIRRKLPYKREHCRARSYIIRVAGIEVFEANFEQHLWTAVRTLGNDQALFLGQGCSRAVRVSPYDLSRDCIFFLDDYINWYWKWKRETTSCGLYDMKDEKIYLPLPMVSWRSKILPATWIFSQGSQENEVVAQPEEPEVVVQEATEEEEQEEELQECPDHHPSSFEKDGQMYYGYCINCLYPVIGDA
ncbi:uncharacterized protein LOC8083015 isoform X2 [Sorghum bicolor]|nr:uncharacterized protein LOC8083015 isoform X2 [Sorghum bicolor]|eukprot:XP_021317170.1 uncharacterized protein LOC8083015 isoform X2 [Sorghum bicolor]